MRRKQLSVLILAVVLASLGVYGWATDSASTEMLRLIGTGVTLAIIYVACRGRLPDWIHQLARINRDDDPSNLSPRIYLPILLTVIVVAVIVFSAMLKR